VSNEDNGSVSCYADFYNNLLYVQVKLTLYQCRNSNKDNNKWQLLCRMWLEGMAEEAAKYAIQKILQHPLHAVRLYKVIVITIRLFVSEIYLFIYLFKKG